MFRSLDIFQNLHKTTKEREKDSIKKLGNL